MERKILFRGKRKANGVWVIGYYGFLHDGDRHVIMCETVSNQWRSYFTDYEVYPVTVGQYIGLKDKNGSDIYEGDIVKVEDGEYAGVVKFNDQDLSYVIEDKSGGYGFVNGQTYDKWPEYRTYEVIGNIYENPELLDL